MTPVRLLWSVPAARTRIAATLSGASALAVAGCATVSPYMPPIEAAPPPASVAAIPASYLYHLQVGDVIAVRFPLNPELNDQLTIGPDGKISTADVDDVPAAGRSASDLAADLRQRYLGVLRKPELSVSVRSFNAPPVFVAGEVVAPGEFRGDTMLPTLSQAIARAGGLRTSGSARHVFVIRRSADRPVAYAARYDRVIDGEADADVRLAPYDLVYVPRTSVAEAYLYFNQYVQQFLPISWGFSYQINPYPTQGR